jgi:hypothetical protein
MPHTLDSNEHLVDVQLIPQSWPAVSQTAGERLAEFLAPATNGPIGDVDAQHTQYPPERTGTFDQISGANS